MPTRSSIHARPRSDSGAARLWEWARTRRAPWTCDEAADAADLSPRRSRAIVAALHGENLVIQVAAYGPNGNLGWLSAQWQLSAAGRRLSAAPILTVDRETGAITGVRFSVNGDGVDILRRHIRRSGLSGRAAAAALGVNDRTLRRILAGETPLAAHDPLIDRARALRSR